MTYLINIVNDQGQNTIATDQIILQESYHGVLANGAYYPVPYDITNMYAERPYTGGGVTGASIGGGNVLGTSSRSSTGYVEYSVLNMLQSSLAGTHGLALYDQYGNLRFDSNKKLLKHIGTYDISSIATPAGAPIAISITKTFKKKMYFSLMYGSYYFYGSIYYGGAQSYWVPKVTYTSENSLSVYGEWSPALAPFAGGVYVTSGIAVWRIFVFEI